MIFRILCIALFLWTGVVTARPLSVQDSVTVYMQKIKTCDNDTLKIAYAAQINGWLEQLEFGTYGALTPIQFLGYKRCTNAGAELFSWTIPLAGGLAYYNLFKFEGKGKNIAFNCMPGVSGAMPPYLFYDLLAFKSGKEDYFVLFGWSQSEKSNRKILQVVRIDDAGQIHFNIPLLQRGKSKSAFMTFEYAKQAGMLLKHDKKGKRIVLDQLAPSEPRYEGYFMLYGPSGTVNAFHLKKGMWIFEENVKI